MLDRLLSEAETRRSGRRARLVALALVLGLLVAVMPLDPSVADLAPLVDALFVIQVVFALGALAFALVRLSAGRAERRALGRYALALIVANDQRRRAVEERDDLVRTITSLRGLNDELREELRERDEAVASAVHELRTPLTSVHAYGQLMSRNLQAVQRQVEQLERLIADLLALPGAKPLAPAEVDLVALAREAAHRIRVVADVTVQTIVRDDGPHVVRGDGGRLAQVLDNLLRNAAKFSPPGRPIDIEVRRDGDEAVVSVTDRGAGIPPNEIALIFERYYRGSDQRRSVPGEGIGLAVCREIVLLHGGRIWATSAGTGRGSTFSVALPLRRASEPEPARDGDEAAVGA